MHFEGNHSGTNMANVLIHTVDHYHLHKKVHINSHQVFLPDMATSGGWFTADNGSEQWSCPATVEDVTSQSTV